MEQDGYLPSWMTDEKASGKNYTIFLSHRAEVKGKVQELKEGLERYGVSAFVAHSDIQPGKEWQEKILDVLGRMDAFVALLTDGFRDSKWTDQEIGYAIARGVPIISLRFDMDPYGFIEKYQALTCSWEDAPREIIKLLIDHSPVVDAYINAVSECRRWPAANQLAEILPSISQLTDEQVDRLVSAFNDNREVSGSFGFNGTYPSAYGPGVAEHLHRITGREFFIRQDSQDRFTLGDMPF